MNQSEKYCIVIPINPKDTFGFFCDTVLELYNQFLDKNEISKFIFIIKSEFKTFLEQKLSKFGFEYLVLDDDSLISEHQKSIRGWYKQQIFKFAASEYVDTDHYLILDDDLIPIKPIRFKNFFNRGRIIYSFEAWPDNGPNYSTNSEWWKNSCKLLNYDVTNIANSNTNMGVTPQVFKKSHVLGLISHIQEVNNTTDWKKAFCDAEATEFCSYWAYILKMGLSSEYTIHGEKLWEHHLDINVLTRMDHNEVFGVIKKALIEKRHCFMVIQSYLNYPTHLYEKEIRKTITNNMKIDQKFEQMYNTPSDINEHLPILREFAEKCDTVVELGTGQTVSTWAFLAGRPKLFVTVDLLNPEERGINFTELFDAAKEENIEFIFLLSDSRKITLEECDLLFIDTMHNYDVLKEELRVHSSKVKKYIILHDTISFGDHDEFGDGPGLVPAVKEFLKENKEWKEKMTYANNNGLTILEKRSL